MSLENEVKKLSASIDGLSDKLKVLLEKLSGLPNVAISVGVQAEEQERQPEEDANSQQLEEEVKKKRKELKKKSRAKKKKASSTDKPTVEHGDDVPDVGDVAPSKDEIVSLITELSKLLKRLGKDHQLVKSIYSETRKFLEERGVKRIFELPPESFSEAYDFLSRQIGEAKEALADDAEEDNPFGE